MDHSIFKNKLRLLLTMLAVIVSLFDFGFVDVFAKTSLDYFLLAEEPTNKNSSVFYVSLFVKGKAVLSAATVSLSFSSEQAELSSVSGGSSTFELRSIRKKTSAKTILLCENGYSFKKQACLLTYRFKKKTDSHITINLAVSDTVDYKLNPLAVGKVDGCDLYFANNERIVTYKNSSTAKAIKKKNEKSTSPAETTKPSLKIEASSITYDRNNSEEIIPETAEENTAPEPSTRTFTKNDDYSKSDSEKKINSDMIIFGVALCASYYLISYFMQKYKLKMEASEDKVPKKYRKPKPEQSTEQDSFRNSDIKVKKISPSKYRLRPNSNYKKADEQLKREVRRRRSNNSKEE